LATVAACPEEVRTNIHTLALQRPNERAAKFAYRNSHKPKTQVLELDTSKRRLKLGIKQLVPTSIDEYLAEHQPGDVVSGRIVEVVGDSALTELGEGILATCRMAEHAGQEPSGTKQPDRATVDIKSLSSMLAARWKAGAVAESSKPQEVRAGQVRSFRITKLNSVAKKIEVELS